MLTSLLPLFIALIPFAIIIFLVYHFAGKKAGKISTLQEAIQGAAQAATAD